MVGWVGAQRPACEDASIAGSSVEERDGGEQRDECVEAEGFGEVTAEQSRERACGSAARADDVQVLVDGAAGIEAVERGWEAQKDCDSECCDDCWRSRSPEVCRRLLMVRCMASIRGSYGALYFVEAAEWTK
jgi:hypothetical protein